MTSCKYDVIFVLKKTIPNDVIINIFMNFICNKNILEFIEIQHLAVDVKSILLKIGAL